MAHDGEEQRLAHHGLVPGGVVQVHRFHVHQVGVRDDEIELEVEGLARAAHRVGGVAPETRADVVIGGAVVQPNLRQVDVGLVEPRQVQSVGKGRRAGLCVNQAHRAKNRRVIQPAGLPGAIKPRRVGGAAQAAPRGVERVTREHRAEVGERAPGGEVGRGLNPPIVVLVAVHLDLQSGRGQLQLHPPVGGADGQRPDS